MSDFEVDVIIAGGGTAGCIVAGRLAAADPSLKILVIEAGPTTREDDGHIQPIRLLGNLMPTSNTVKFQVGKPSEDLGGRAPIVPCGQCLGGGSSVNCMMYTRASVSDYDEWERNYGATGWGYKDLLPYFEKMETYQVNPEKETHGSSGPLKVSYGGFVTNVGLQLLEAAKQYDSKRTVVDDPNNFHTGNSYGRWAKWIDQSTGRRSDIPHYYVYHQLENTGLQVLTGYLVKRVIIENGRAVGVEFVGDPRFHSESEQQVRTARARKLVVVSAGAFGSPAILERSGVGSAERLKNFGIESVVDLPGVGENYQDHQGGFVTYVLDDQAETFDGLVQGRPEEFEKWTKPWLENGSGMIASNGVDVGGKLRPTPEELEELGPEFKEHWKANFENAPDKPVLWIGLIALYLGVSFTHPGKKVCTIAYFAKRPASIGHVHISSTDVHAPLDFDPKFLHEKADLTVLRWGYKRGRELMRRVPLFRGEWPPDHPSFPEGSAAAANPEVGPVSPSDPDIVYTTEDDEAIDTFTRKAVATIWHSLGTCAMKPREQNGVVDPKLNVYGVAGLKVADMSIAPSNVCSNTYSTAIVIGEKAADIIAAELGLQLKPEI